MNNLYFESKYENKSFSEALDLSQELVKTITSYFTNAGFITRPFDDKNPFIFPGGSDIRGLDIFCGKNGASYYIDAKDYPRLLFHPATGITRYVYNRYKYIQQETGIKVIVFFIDNEEFERKNKNRQKSKFKKENLFLPYGDFLDNFIPYYRQNIPNSKGQTQVLWCYEEMKDIETIIKNLIQN